MTLVTAVRWGEVLLFTALWALVARSDWTQRKVRHGHIAAGAAGAALGYLLLLGQTALGQTGELGLYYEWSFYRAAAVHFGVSAAAGLALWQLRLWPAGDAKLFALLAAVYPLIEGSFSPDRLFLSALINTFIPASFALFAGAAWYAVSTRLIPKASFAASLGLRRALEDGLARARAALSGARPPTWSEVGAAAAGLLPQVGQWVFGMALMSVLAFYLKGTSQSPLTLALICMALMTLWGQSERLLGPVWPKVIAAGAGIALLAWKPLDWQVLGGIAGSLSVFSFCMFLGMSAATRMLAGGWSAAAFALPFVGMGVSFAFAYLSRMAASAWRTVRDRLQGLEHALPAAPQPSAAGLLDLSALGPLPPFAAAALELAGLGVFFGLSLVLVRLWDEEVRPTHRAEALSANLLLAPAFIRRLEREDTEFAGGLGSLYADGLTQEQAQALKEWCLARGVAEVPLAPTVSFAAWIFAGVFLTLALQGRHVLEAVL